MEDIAFKANRSMRFPSFTFMVLLSALALTAPFAQCSHVTAQRAVNAAVPPPPLGWSSWNSFSNLINSSIVQAQAQALIHTGLAKAGYSYINIDEGWWLGTRDADGNIVVEAERWPAIAPGEKAGDMSNIVHYIHALGLKAGIYTDAGESGCSFYGPDLGPPMPHTGSEGHYAQDFLQFARWGFDYVKVDWCGGDRENLDPAAQYAEIAHAIRMAEVITGHKLYYSICNWGARSPWTWAPGIGDSSADIWRTGGDIVAPVVAGTPNANRKATFAGMLSNFDNNLHPEAQHTGFYNDADMMVAGMPGLSESQNRVHITLWSLSSSPMILGADITKLSPETLSMITNRDVLAIDQDPLGLQPILVSAPGAPVEVWSKVLADSQSGHARRAIVLLNRTKSQAQSSLPLARMGLATAQVSVRDVWASKQLNINSDDELTVKPEDARLLVAEGVATPSEHFTAITRLGAGGESPATHVWIFNGINAHSQFAVARITYTNSTDKLAQCVLRMDGDRQTAIAFPYTGNAFPQAVTIIVKLPAIHNSHEISLSTDYEGQLSIQSLELLNIGQ